MTPIFLRRRGAVTVLRITLCLLFLCSISSNVNAAMNVDRAVITFASGASEREDVMVSNPGEESLYIDVQVLDVTNPGAEDEKREVVKDPESIGLVATPRRLVVPAGGQRVVRLVNLEGYQKEERVYRVNLKPRSGPVDSEKTGVHVMVGYQLLVFIEPRKVNVDLRASRDGRELQLHNTGNVNVRIHHGEQCPPQPAQGQECRDLKGLRLYPGNQETLELPYDAPVTFTVSASDESSKRRFQ